MTKKRNGNSTNKNNESVLSLIEILNGVLGKKVKVSAKNQSQRDLIRSIKDKEITICSGKAGTGKTFVSLAYALNLLQTKNNKYEKIYLIKSVTTLKGEEVGYLKGDLKEKIDPFMWSFKINMSKILNETEIKSLFDNKIVEALPLAFARGVSLDNCIIIADEMQNVSYQNSRTLLTRIGENSKIILLGDTNQIDLKGNQSSLEPLLNMFENVNGFGCIRMNDKHTNVRNPIIDVIENKFESNKEGKNGK